MTEQLLQYLWKFQNFNAGKLKTVAGEEIVVLRAGTHNHNQGPDFLDAVVIIEGIKWIGAVELHLRTGDWHRHDHEGDRFYTNVILHVVWDHDRPVNELPVLELRDRISNLLLTRYAKLMLNEAFIPCNGNIGNLSALSWMGWKDRLLFERLERKASLVQACFTGNNWYLEECCWWLLARSAGLLVNADAFEEIARSVPYSAIMRHRNSILHLEAMLLGQAGQLDDDSEDPYFRALAREYIVLQRKYGLRPVRSRLQFLRMRPANFPALRLVQLAAIVHRVDGLLGTFIQTSSLKQMKKILIVKLEEVWRHRFFPGRQKPIITGQGLRDNIIINAIVPVLFFHANHKKDDRYSDRAIGWLEQIHTERNHITDSFARLGFPQQNASDSQAMLELKRCYCDQRKCLDCAIGYSILNPRLPSQHSPQGPDAGS